MNKKHLYTLCAVLAVTVTPMVAQADPRHGGHDGQRWNQSHSHGWHGQNARYYAPRWHNRYYTPVRYVQPYYYTPYYEPVYPVSGFSFSISR